MSGNAASALLRRHQGRYSAVHIREEPPDTSFAGGAPAGGHGRQFLGCCCCI
ncbi:hypothetical protein D3OALGA1CA_380 [Olavius algarvensis associated proteobacterium Delta 3]|nr:hypothetical protein D3OALGA1CA_380 [Olavius algarvensis associated proteobacterium Delta 3]